MASTPKVEVVKFHYSPGPSHPHMKEEYWVVCNEGMVEKWRKDPSIPLIDVVQVFDIFAGTGRTYRPNKNEIENVFGAGDNNEVIKKILKEGKLTHSSGFAGRGPQHN